MDEGVVKARDFRRKAQNAGTRGLADFEKFAGVPWEPNPGATGEFELRSKVRPPCRTSGAHGDRNRPKRLY